MSRRCCSARVVSSSGEDEWNAEAAALADRGLVDDGGLTAAGQDLRARVEAETDRLSAAPWQGTAPDEIDAFIDYCRSLTRAAVSGMYICLTV